METQEWRSMVGFEGIYEISRLGYVRSIDRVFVKKTIVNFGTEIKEKRTFRSGKDILPKRVGGDGPLGVVLSKNKLKVTLLIKQLMKAAWPDVDYSDDHRLGGF